VKPTQQFYERSKVWLDDIMEKAPMLATHLGDVRFNHTLGDQSLKAQGAFTSILKGMQEELAAMDVAEWSNDAQIDHTVMAHITNSLLRSQDTLQERRRNPAEYLDIVTSGIMLLVLKEYAPLSERLAAILGRTKDVPQVLADAKTNLIPTDVPRVWAETTIDQAQMSPMLFTMLLPSLAQQAAPDLADEMIEAGKRAAEAIEDYVNFLTDTVLPQATEDFAVGKDIFNEILREDHMVDYDADELLDIGWEQFKLTKKLMEDVAQEIDPNKSVRDLLEEAKADHPTADGLLQAYRDAMTSAKQFVVDHDIASIPDQESLKVIETPAYLRPILPYAAYMPAGMLEEEQKGVFLVTPAEATASAEEQEQKLKGHFYVKLPVTALHEAYPGHHLQLTWANRTPTLPRRLGSFLSTLFIEGWAFYCEEMMEQMGYISKPIQRLGRLSDQLWRAGRIILDVSLHTKGMTVDEAVDFLVDECQLERTNAMAEVRRYTSTPTQPQSYLMGKLEILDLVAGYKKQNPQASLREMHDAMLGAGSLPPRLMRKALLTD